MKALRSIALCFVFAVSVSLFPIGTDTDYTVSTDWESGMIRIDVEKSVPKGMSLTPKLRYDLETRAELAMPEIFMAAIGSINVTSLATVAESVSSRKVNLELFKTLSSAGTKTPGFITEDFGKISVTFAYPFHGENGLVRCFVFHTNPIQIRREPGIADTGKFTGLVIYAKGFYPLYAKQTSGRLAKALFPAIYDDEMNLVLSREMCDPASLAKWGMALYTSSPDEKKFSERIGVAPLRTMASALFGTRNTDIVIPSEDAEKLCATAESRRILSEGRILIIAE